MEGSKNGKSAFESNQTSNTYPDCYGEAYTAQKDA
jgi:hypothetical protein